MGSDGKLHFVDSAGADTALNFSSGELIHIPYKTYPAGSSFKYTFKHPPKGIIILVGVGDENPESGFHLDLASWVLIYIKGEGVRSAYLGATPSSSIGNLTVSGNTMIYPANGLPEREKYIFVAY